jgi:hypothetical protein
MPHEPFGTRLASVLTLMKSEEQPVQRLPLCVEVLIGGYYGLTGQRFSGLSDPQPAASITVSGLLSGNHRSDRQPV